MAKPSRRSHRKPAQKANRALEGRWRGFCRRGSVPRLPAAAFCDTRGKDGITVEVVLSANKQEARLLAKIDTGAQHRIFHRFHGESLGLQVEEGHPQWFRTATGPFLAYGHSVALSVLGLEFDSMVYFAADESFPRNVLGRHGWLQQVRLGLIDYDGKLYLSSYND